jgi:hypothetical protein
VIPAATPESDFHRIPSRIHVLSAVATAWSKEP